MGQPPVASRPTSRLRQWFANTGLAQMRRVFLLVVLVSTVAFGGLDTVDKSVTLFKPGEKFSDGEFTITVERARLLAELRGGGGVVGPAKPGRRYLGVVATIQNDGNVPGRLRDELDLRDHPEKEFFGVWRFNDGSPIQTLGPGLTERLVFTWVLPENAVSPART